jgi:acetyl esterase/lipase
VPSRAGRRGKATELGVDPDRIGVMSAGGGRAAALTILARARQGPNIARQILLMPSPTLNAVVETTAA